MLRDMAGNASRDTPQGREEASFGARLRRLREAAGLTQEELASKAGLSARAVSVIERGERRRPYPHTVRSLAEALGLSEDERASLFASLPARSANVLPASAPSSTESGLPLASPTALVGRERDLKGVATFLGRPGVRLLTLTGTGGVGKTCLALAAARASLAEAGLFPDGVAFVALAPLGDAALVVPTVARSLGLREMGGRSPRDALHAYLREKRFLLVLDNFEHVLEAAPEVGGLVESCQGLTVLVTSRAPLRVRGEQEYPVGPLALPASTSSPAAEEVAGSSSGRLFLERAKATSPAFEVTEENAGAVAAICWRLSGLPLALELAAAKMRFLDASALLGRLDRALAAGSGARDVPERQRTMRSTLDWSYDLLHEPEKELFRRLSIFAGGFELEAAEEVCSTGAVESWKVLVLLGNLVEQSLVLADTSPGGGTRYRMLEPVRQYALERLRESGEEEAVRWRHAAFYLALAEEAQPRIKGHDQVEWLDRLESENDNLRAAISWSLEAGEAETAARFGWALAMYWVMRARQSEGRLLMEQTLTSDLPARMRARTIWALGACIYGSGNDERLIALCEEGVALSREAGDARTEAYSLGMIGFAAVELGDLDRAARVLENALRMDRERGDAWGAAHVLIHLAVVARRRGEHPLATGYAEEALALTRQTGDRFAAEGALQLLAQMAWASDERERAARRWREALGMASGVGTTVDSAYCMQGLAAVAAARDEARRVARLLGAAEGLLEAAGLVLHAYARNELHEHAASSARERLDEQVWTAAYDEGRAMDFEEAVAYALGGEEALPPARP
jgi:predicted ATPase/transcriptional regulator with XRE-family HTH domain